jgi:hypothetical protein
MKKEYETVILTNDEGQRLRIYKIENTGDDFYIGIGLEGEGQDHFFFRASEAEMITNAINTTVDQ